MRDTTVTVLLEMGCNPGSLPDSWLPQAPPPAPQVLVQASGQSQSILPAETPANLHLFHSLSASLASQPEEIWQQYYRLMEDKYLRLRLQLPSPDFRDLRALIGASDIKSLFVPQLCDEQTFSNALERIGQDASRPGSLFSGSLPFPVRWLKGNLMKLVSGTTPSATQLDPVFYIGIALKACLAERETLKDGH